MHPCFIGSTFAKPEYDTKDQDAPPNQVASLLTGLSQLGSIFEKQICDIVLDLPQLPMVPGLATSRQPYAFPRHKEANAQDRNKALCFLNNTDTRFFEFW